MAEALRRLGGLHLRGDELHGVRRNFADGRDLVIIDHGRERRGGTDARRTFGRLGVGLARLDEHRHRGDAIGEHQVRHRLTRTGHGLRWNAWPCGNPAAIAWLPTSAGAALLATLAFGAQPAVVGSVHLRLEHGIGNALRQIDAGEQDLLDDLAGLVAELGLERHGSLLVDPQAIAVAIFIARMQRDHARGAAEQSLAFAAADLVDLRIAIVDRQATRRAAGRPASGARPALSACRGNNR